MTSREVALITRRRRFTLEQKRQILVEAARTSMADVARHHGIARPLLQKWKQALGGSLEPAVAGFARLVPTAREVATSEDARIFVHVDELVIELPATAAPEQVAALVRALRQ